LDGALKSAWLLRQAGANQALAGFGPLAGSNATASPFSEGIREDRSLAAGSPGVVANDLGARKISVFGAPGRTPMMCRRTSVRRSIFGVDTRLRATLVRQLSGSLFREVEGQLGGRSASSEVEAPRI
jgi:hypothetical protein